MKKILLLFTVALFTSVAHAETLSVTFGATTDLSARYGDIDLSGNAKQNDDIAAPLVTVTGLDLDGLGANDDQIEVRFSVKATGAELRRLAAGYRLDKGMALTFGITSAKMVYGTGKTKTIDGRFVSASGNNRGSSFTTENTGGNLVVKSTATGNNRARSIVAEFDVPVDSSTRAAPLVVQVADEPAATERASRKIGRAPKAKTAGAPGKPPKAIAPPTITTDSLLLPRLFCDDMILQQEMKNTFWGWAKAGERITVKASWGTQASAKANASGKWKLYLETPAYGTGHSLTISGKTDTININNVAIGEVWLCAGQSNMGWSMGNSFEAEKEADVNLPDGWGYTPLHYASVRGGNDLIEYLVSQGADVTALSTLGQSTADLARGGRAGYFSRPPYPETVELLQSLGSELKCLNSHFRGTGDWCPGAGVAPFEVERNGPPIPGRD